MSSGKGYFRGLWFRNAKQVALHKAKSGPPDSAFSTRFALYIHLRVNYIAKNTSIYNKIPAISFLK